MTQLPATLRQQPRSHFGVARTPSRYRTYRTDGPDHTGFFFAVRRCPLPFPGPWWSVRRRRHLSLLSPSCPALLLYETVCCTRLKSLWRILLRYILYSASCCGTKPPSFPSSASRDDDECRIVPHPPSPKRPRQRQGAADRPGQRCRNILVTLRISGSPPCENC